MGDKMMASAAIDRAVKAPAPVGEINMTPLIDVLLVLLIMFIITIPIATNAVEIDVGVGEGSPIDPVINKVVVTEGGAVLWNGEAVSRRELATNLTLASRVAPEPELQFEPEANASYDLSARTLSIIEASPVTKFGFVGNEKYRKFTTD
ncbi:biopolymer transporter ExbD [Citromicrobium sp. WPS32]|uniref:ExbD/TolR family protein n=1 Tax=Citromicrobium sp. WPS32 TaxID=1634517 RepID=UPI0009E7FCC8|nr:biopolymer transporter ExbD [Citromicrobium sp. WPS32]MAY76101.1 biopolymer transporter ExbD [Citromicrobium sp.]|tara:strand:+ start:823 stop:1269 length:447 start_codon:yes stop_codon:yes gene_type:complete